jgi:hypothetical protein
LKEIYGELPQHTRSLGCVQHGYIPHYDPSNLILTQKTKELKSQYDYTINVILNSISEKIAILFCTTEIASEMLETLLNRFEGNTQMKRTKLMGLESEFKKKLYTRKRVN